MSGPLIVFVVGTGTDIGKTHVTAALRRATPGAGAWKPIATGMARGDALGDDARAIEASEPPLHGFEPPISPHLAARQVGVTIVASEVARAARRIAASFAVLFVESAGGLFSPISNSETNFDLAKALGAETRILLVAPDRIGVLHDVRATGLALDVVALSAPERSDASTGTNAAEIVTLGLARHVVVFPRAPLESAGTASAAASCRELLLRAAAVSRT